MDVLFEMIDSFALNGVFYLETPVVYSKTFDLFALKEYDPFGCNTTGLATVDVVTAFTVVVVVVFSAVDIIVLNIVHVVEHFLVANAILDVSTSTVSLHVIHHAEKGKHGNRKKCGGTLPGSLV